MDAFAGREFDSRRLHKKQSLNFDFCQSSGFFFCPHPILSYQISSTIPIFAGLNTMNMKALTSFLLLALLVACQPQNNEPITLDGKYEIKPSVGKENVSVDVAKKIAASLKIQMDFRTDGHIIYSLTLGEKKADDQIWTYELKGTALTIVKADGTKEAYTVKRKGDTIVCKGEKEDIVLHKL